ncbi:hypothetical protein BFJ63_vAg17229 [Fusarium oxysporum f. sp. narcissi]|uniref:Zn(2)-C6 fungal-type domain-containing protein n=1 Tax=Fusarium oxysporum f. sp. narcissi TaxID=451672 RepID=A0A4Q2V6Q3_FUSOX|nr:hypothetical protein BFJ63_vAg17229 [Fusarium oxysporum f. sp. narcissi]
MSASIQSHPNPQPVRAKKKTKTFTGCWTCRARRVKCDEGRPCCNRCTRSRFTCQGYGLRLGWKQEGGQGDKPVESSFKSTPFRKLVELNRNFSPGPSEALDDLLQKCNNSTVGPRTLSFGPFSVFRVVSPQASSLSSLEPEDATDIPPNESPESWTQCSSRNAKLVSSVSPDVSSTDSNRMAAPPLAMASSPETFRQYSPGKSQLMLLSDPEFWHALDIDLLTTSSSDLQMPSLATSSTAEDQHEGNGLYHSYDQDGEINGILPGEERLAESQRNTPITSDSNHSTPARSDPGLSHYRIAGTTSSRKEAELVHHWVIFMCKNLVPIDAVDNPYRVVYLKLASQARDCSQNCSSSILAIFHGLCSAAAESLNNLHGDKGYHAKSSPMFHANAALHHLRLCVTSSSRHDDYINVLAAISMCILRDTVSGQPRNWRIHGQAAIGIARRVLLRGGIEPGSNAHTLVEQYLALAAFANLSAYDDLQDLLDRLPSTDHYLSKQQSVTRISIEFLGLINTLSRGNVEPELAVLDNLELRIYLEAAPSNDVQDVSGRSKDRAVIQHYRYVYYYAILLHFHRVLRHKAPSEVQDLAEKGLHHLEAAENFPGDCNGCIILWPCLVIISECEREDLQKRALRWLRRKIRHAFGSVNASEKICREYWSWRAENPVESRGTPWLDFVAGTDLDVVPV